MGSLKFKAEFLINLYRVSERCNKIIDFMEACCNEVSSPFLQAVELKMLNFEDYHLKIKSPMDLSTIKTKVDHNQYESTEEFAADMRLIFSNCFRYYEPSSLIVKQAHETQQIFEYYFSQLGDLDDDSDSDSDIELYSKICKKHEQIVKVKNKIYQLKQELAMNNNAEELNEPGNNEVIIMIDENNGEN